MAALDHQSYPHIFDRILSHVPLDGLPTLRPTAKIINEQVSAIMYRHIVFNVEPNDLMSSTFVDPYEHCRIPGLRVDGDDQARRVTAQRVCRYTRTIDYVRPSGDEQRFGEPNDNLPPTDTISWLQECLRSTAVRTNVPNHSTDTKAWHKIFGPSSRGIDTGYSFVLRIQPRYT